MARPTRSPRSRSAARSAPPRRWRRCRSCASPRPTTSRSASGSSKPAPTTSSPGRSTAARSRRASRRCCCASSARRTSRRSSRPTASRSGGRAGPSPSTARRAASGRPRSRRTSPWRRRKDRPDRVVLVDLSLQFGGVATHLNLDPKQTLADVIRDEAALREPELLRTYAMRHDSGLHVLAAPGNPEIGRAHHAGPRRAPARDPAGGLRRRSSSTPAPCSTSGRSPCSRPPRP